MSHDKSKTESKAPATTEQEAIEAACTLIAYLNGLDERGMTSQLQIQAHGEYVGTWEVSVEMLHAPGEALPAELRAPHLNS